MTFVAKRYIVYVKRYGISQNIKKEGENMSEKEKQILETIDEALPNMSEFDKGYFLGVAESNAREKKKKKKNEAEEN